MESLEIFDRELCRADEKAFGRVGEVDRPLGKGIDGEGADETASHEGDVRASPQIPVGNLPAGASLILGLFAVHDQLSQHSSRRLGGELIGCELDFCGGELVGGVELGLPFCMEKSVMKSEDEEIFRPIEPGAQIPMAALSLQIGIALIHPKPSGKIKGVGLIDGYRMRLHVTEGDFFLQKAPKNRAQRKRLDLDFNPFPLQGDSLEIDLVGKGAFDPLDLGGESRLL